MQEWALEPLYAKNSPFALWSVSDEMCIKHFNLKMGLLEHFCSARHWINNGVTKIKFCMPDSFLMQNVSLNVPQ